MERNYLNLCDFNHEIYRNHKDLKSMSNAELETHFLIFGIPEGRVYNHIQNREGFLKPIDYKNGNILEIGPLDHPQLDYTSPRYYSLDVFTKEQLIKNYSHDPGVNKEKIIEPSYVIVNNDYSPIKEKFKCVFSSHSIEHVPCVVTFLNNLETVLSDDGQVYLIIPDKRYCFDHFKQETDIYDVLQLFYEKNYRPRLKDYLKMVSQVTHNNCVEHWNGNHGSITNGPLLQHYHGISQHFRTGAYMDAHVSFFTPQNFMEIIGILHELKLINLEIHKMYHTLRNNLEFYVILKKAKG